MRKNFINKYFICFSLLFIILLILFYSFSKKEVSDTGVKEFENIFKQNLPNGVESEELYNSYSGVPYEGEKLYSFLFSEENATIFISEIESSDYWNPLPLSESLNLIMFGGSKDNTEYMHKFADKVGLPNIKNGYWKFINQNEGSDILEYSSFNFSLVIYDSDNNIMYLYKIDT